jgi:hypothetical protein
MKFKASSDNKKPWEKISLNEIQPYPSPYNKVIVTAYLFAFSVLFIKFMSVNSILDDYIPFIKLVVYGTFAFILLKMVLKKTNESVWDVMLVILPFYTIFIIIINFLILLVTGIPLANVLTLLNPNVALYALIFYFYVFFGMIGWLMSSYFLMSEHPKIQIHGLILILLLLFYFTSGQLMRI